MLKFYFSLFLLAFSTFSFSQKNEEQTIDNWLLENNYTEPDYLITISSPKPTNKLGDSQIETLKLSEKELIKKALKNKISEKINELSLIDFNNLEKYFFESDKKAIKVVCIINKKEVSEYWVKDIERKLDNLKSSLSENQVSGQLTSSKIEEMLNNSKKVRKDIDLYEQIAFKLNPNMDMSSINLVKIDIDGRINDLNSRMDKTIVIEKIRNAQRKKNNQDFIGAYSSFKDLQMEYPNNTEVINGVEESYNTLIKIYDYRILQFEINENYESAIKTVDSLIKLDIDLLRKYESKLIVFRNKKFYNICDKIEKLLTYKSVSGEQLKNYMNELKNLKDIDPEKYEKLKSNSEKRLLEYDIKLIKSDVYNRNYTEALAKIPILKSTYSRSRSIESFEKKIDRTIYKKFKSDVLSIRPRLYNFEPGISLISSPYSLNSDLTKSQYNLNIQYSLGLYRRVNIKQKNKVGKFRYSTIGIKSDYLDSKIIFNSNDSLIYSKNNTFSNNQISIGIRKFLYLDFGYLYFINNTQTNLYNSTISIYLPLGYFSIGASTRYLTDFKQKNMIVASAGLKFNFGFVKKYNSDDKREIETSILKLKQ